MPERNEKPQVEKFKEAARELETDQSEEAFDRVLKKVAKSPPPKDDKPKKASN
ncbi:hypothetical protein NKH61_27635 [Mesorhizobium sp. M1005]|uniref:hypothetical protein n=1 Tax=unclassified Mesorhizobium TaxID=325217 RepID=UPI00333D1282